MKTLLKRIAGVLGFLFVAGLTWGDTSVRVEGSGYLRFCRDGFAVYARQAKLSSIGGKLCGPGGVPLIPEISVSEGFTVGPDGKVTTAGGSTAGRIVLAVFTTGAEPNGSGDYLEASDRPTYAFPQSANAGALSIDGKTATAAPTVKKEPAATSTTPKQAPAATNTKPTITRIAAGIKIVVRPISEIETVTAKLGDIADISADEKMLPRLQAIQITQVPLIGFPQTLEQTWIEAKLKGAGIKEFDLTVPNGAQVARQCQIIPADKFAEVALTAARQRFNITEPFVAERNDKDFPAPKGKLDLSVESCTQNANSINVTIGVYVDDKRFNSRFLVLKPDASAVRIAVGAPVKILIRCSGAVVETTGKTRGSGWQGQTIQVQTDNGVTFTGKITGPGKVEVEL